MDRLKTRSDINGVIKRVCEAEGLQTYKIVDVKTNDKGEGYLGQIWMVSITDEDGDKNLNFVIKSAFKEEQIRQAAPIRMSFENEVYFYSEVYPEFKKFDSSHELVPKSLAVSLENESEMLAMENLKMKGFEVFDKKSILDHDHVKLIFKTYGRFHGYSFVMKDQYPEEYQNLASKTQDVYQELIFNSEMNRNNTVAVGKIVEDMLKPGEDDKIIEAYENLRGQKILEEFENALTSDCTYSAILHGDCWSNNMMFSYEITDGKKTPTDIRLIDFQLMKVGSPTCDLSYFLYSGASKKEFDRLDEYLEIYHESFSSFLRSLGSDPDKLFPLKELKEQWRIHSKFGLCMALFILKMKVTNQEDILDFTDNLEDDAFVKMKYDEDAYYLRVRDVLMHMVEIGAL